MPAPECFSPEKRRRAWQQHMLKDQSVPQKSQTSKTVHNNKLQKEHLYVPVSLYLVQEGTGGKRERKSSGKQCVKEFCFHFRLQSQRKKAQEVTYPSPWPQGEISLTQTILDRRRCNAVFKTSFPCPVATALASLSPDAGLTSAHFPSVFSSSPHDRGKAVTSVLLQHTWVSSWGTNACERSATVIGSHSWKAHSKAETQELHLNAIYVSLLRDPFFGEWRSIHLFLIHYNSLQCKALKFWLLPFLSKPALFLEDKEATSDSLTQIREFGKRVCKTAPWLKHRQWKAPASPYMRIHHSWDTWRKTDFHLSKTQAAPPEDTGR